MTSNDPQIVLTETSNGDYLLAMADNSQAWLVSPIVVDVCQ